MSNTKQHADDADTTAVAERVRTALVVDDSRLQLKILTSLLGGWGFETTVASSGREALDICQTRQFDFVLSDWMMPEMNGIEFCKALRDLKSDTYSYFLLLTSKTEKAEIANGLDAGADDFLTKPVHSEELRARLTAGERILKMQEELVEKNRLVSHTLEEIRGLYEALDRDLIEARKLQQSLVKERFRSFGSSQVSLLLQPSGHVGGDLVGFFPINSRRVGLYSIDVSGHGVASALMTARLAGYLSNSSPDSNVALFEGEFGNYDVHPPDEVARILNDLTLTEMETENYFTMVFADVDLVSGKMKMVQAGHPHPVIQRADGRIEFLGGGGPPVGLIEDMEYQSFDATLEPGDRLVLITDGVTECPSPDGDLLDDDGFSRLLENSRNISGTAFFDAMMWDLSQYAGDQDFPDDVSAILFEFNHAKKNLN